MEERHWSREEPRAEAKLMEILAAVKEAATNNHGKFNSAHEGLAVIQEEFEKLKAEVFKRDRSMEAMEQEASQLAAMAIRFLADVIYY